MRFQGKTAIVTGAGAGIGRAAALGFAAEGARVMLNDIAAEAVAATAAEIRAAGGEASCLAGDATRENEVMRLVAGTVAEFGGLDIAFNNVGFSWGTGVEQITEEEWDRSIAVSLKAPWLAMKHELPVMIAAGGGVIVNTASMAGVSYNETANVAYSAAKAGVIHMTRYAAVAYGPHKVRVNCVSPGLTRTAAVDKFLSSQEQKAMAEAWQPIGRIIEPGEIADAVLWLASDHAVMVTGENICVAGGAQAK